MSKRKRSGGRSRNMRTAAEHRAAASVPATNVYALKPAEIRALADVVSGSPETGKRTPQPQIDRWTRYRFGDLGPAELVSILNRAKEGQTEALADLWLQMLETDPHLRSVWDSLMAPIYGARWEVTPAEVPEDGDPLATAQAQALAESAQDAADACEEALRGIDSLSRTMAAMLDGVGLGYAVAEILWKRGTLLGQPAWVPAALVPVHGRRFSFSDHFELGLYDAGRAVAELKEAGWDVEELPGRGRSLARLPAGKYVVHQPVTIHDYPTSTGLVFAVARPWLLKQIGLRYYAAGAERFAMPWVHGKMGEQPAGMTMDDFHAGLENLSGQGVLVTRGDTEVNLLDTKGQAGSTVWREFLQYQDAAMSKAVLGSTLNVEIGEAGGNRAAAESQADETISPRQLQHAEQMWASLRRDLFRYVISYNPNLFPPSTPLPSGRTVLAEDPIQVDAEVINSGWLRVNELRESRGLAPLPDEQGDRFVASPMAPSFDPGFAPDATPEVSSETPDAVPVPGVDKQEQALNGAQVTAMLEVVSQVAQGLLPRATAIEIIVAAFPISRAQAEGILGTVGAGFEPSVKVEEGSEPAVPEVDDVPLATPWEEASLALSRAWTSPSAAVTSTPSPTTPSGHEPSR